MKQIMRAEVEEFWPIQMDKNKILIVENERIIAEDIKMMLTKFRCRVAGIINRNTKEIVQRIKEIGPDLILVDDIFGGSRVGDNMLEDLLKKLNIPVIFILDSFDINIHERINSNYNMDYVLKPFDEKDLRLKIENFLPA